MLSSTSSFKRAIPALPWRGMLLATLALTAIGALAWEITARQWGYGPTLNDTTDLWADRREAVQPDSLVIIGDSRALFDLDLDVLEQGLGRRPVQLALVGSCAFPILKNLADDKSFRGTVIVSLVPGMWLAPMPSPPYQNSLQALRRFAHRTVAQRASHHIAMWLEGRIAFLKQDDLTSAQLLKRLELPNRDEYHGPPRLPPYFATLTRDREMKMIAAAEQPGTLQERLRRGWIPLFTPPPPPPYVPREAFLKGMGQAVEARFAATAATVQRIQARGGKVVFVRFPFSGALKELEDRGTPRASTWNRILAESGAPGIHFEDHPELATFLCPEWSHLSASDSVMFTERLVPHLKTALAK